MSGMLLIHDFYLSHLERVLLWFKNKRTAVKFSQAMSQRMQKLPASDTRMHRNSGH